MFDKHKTNADIVEEADPSDSIQYRSAKDEQQLGRADIEHEKTMTGRSIGAAIASVVIGACTYVVIQIGEIFYYMFTNQTMDISERGIMAVPNFLELLLIVASVACSYSTIYLVLKRQLATQNVMSMEHRTKILNEYKNDQHIALPEEIFKKPDFNFAPDAGAHFDLEVSSMISHIMLENKGIKEVMLSEFADTDIFDEKGNRLFKKGELLKDVNENPIQHPVPMFDKEFGEALFDASGMPPRDSKLGKKIRKFYDATKIPYNPQGRRERKNYDTLADYINADYEFPFYEPQRPAGLYIVDTAPVNTMVLAITRAGKGQTVIEATIDMWTREKRQHNMVVNDPKGELLVKNYVRVSRRGMIPVQFNLINPTKTDIYNPLTLAAESARQGDFTRCAMYVNNIADVFFPLDGGDDPVWPNAASNAFKRAAFGLIDYYIEEEKEYRAKAEAKHVSEKVIVQNIDRMWGKVTLYNCYQMFVQLTAKKLKNPIAEAEAVIKQQEALAESGQPKTMTDEEIKQLKTEAVLKNPIWNDQPEQDMLTLYFSATALLPLNEMRKLVNNAHNALMAMAGADKMMASCEPLHSEKLCLLSFIFIGILGRTVKSSVRMIG